MHAGDFSFGFPALGPAVLCDRALSLQLSAGPDGALAGVQGQLLVLQLLELHSGGLAPGAGLQPGQHGADLVLALLLHPATDAGPEEDQGVAQPVFLLVQLDHCAAALSFLALATAVAQMMLNLPLNSG